MIYRDVELPPLVGVTPATPVIVCDPGKRSGLVVAGPGGSPLHAWDADRLDCLQLAETAADRYPRAVLVVERFTISERTIRSGRDDSALRIIGALEWIVHQRASGIVVVQAPYDAMHTVPDSRLRTLGLWVPGREDHARDALRHYVLWCVRAARFRMRG